MHRLIRSSFCALLLAVGALALGGCGPANTKPDGSAPPARAAPNSDYAVYANLVDDQRAAAAARLASLTQAVTACKTDSCVEHVVLMATVASIAAGGSGGGQIAPPQRQISGAEKFAAIVGALSPLAGTMVTGAVQWHQSDTSRDVSIAQYGLLGGVIRDTSAASAAIAQAGPRIEVQGNYGDTYGNGYTGGNRTEVGGSMGGRDVLGEGANSGTIAPITTTTTVTNTDSHDNTGCQTSDCSTPIVEPPPT